MDARFDIEPPDEAWQAANPGWQNVPPDSPRWRTRPGDRSGNLGAPPSEEPEEPQTPLILSPAAPLDSARELVRRQFTHDDGRTIQHQQGTFYVWRGTHYAEMETEETRASIYRFLDGALRIIVKKQLKEIVPFDPNQAKVENVLDALAAEAQIPGTVRAPGWLDTKPHLAAADIVSCTNGLVHLPSRSQLAHSPAFFGLNALGYPFDPAAPKPVAWLKFLGEIWPDDPDAITTLQDIFGLLLTPDTRHQKAFLMVGPKRSGKGTIARVLIALLGRENVAGPTLGSLGENFGLASLIGKPLAIISDARLGGRADAHTIAERLLAISGEDALSVARKFRADWIGQLPTRFLILSNELPRLTDSSGALAGRFVILMLRKSFYGRGACPGNDLPWHLGSLV